MISAPLRKRRKYQYFRPSYHAISSDKARQRIVVNPQLCVGCGACTTVCPTGALGYSYPRPPDQGRKLLATGWDNTAVVSGGSSVLTDAAKRDRTVWSGDLGISAAVGYVSTADTLSVKNALQRLYDSQKASGELPYSGPPFDLYGSDTYHLWTLIGTASYYQYSHDNAWLASEWANYRKAMAFSLGKVDADGMLSVTGTADWARAGQGGQNIRTAIDRNVEPGKAYRYRVYAVRPTPQGPRGTGVSNVITVPVPRE